MRIAFYPKNASKPNSYISRIIEAIRLANHNAEVINVPSLRHLRQFRGIDIAWFNWYENQYSKKWYQFVKEVSIKYITLIILKFLGTKIITVIHNKLPHEIKFPYITKKFYKHIIRIADKIIILCDEGYEVVNDVASSAEYSKITKIHHPCYECTPKHYGEKQNKPFSVAFFGLLRPYKNIELLIEIAKKYPKIEFSIAGMPYSEEYKYKLIKSAQNCRNIKFSFGLKTEEEIDDILETNSILCLPYNLKSSLNSGVVMYALSKGINVIVPKIGTIKEFGAEDNTYSYDYSNEEDHFKAIEGALKTVYDEYNNDYDTFIKKSEIMRLKVTTEYSVEAISKQIKNMLTNIIS